LNNNTICKISSKNRRKRQKSENFCNSCQKKAQKIIFSQINVDEKEKVVLLRPQNKSISINHLKEGSVLK